MNLLRETTAVINEFDHVSTEIVFIGSEGSGHSCTWEEFQTIANIEYDNGFGGQEIASDLIIVFSDGSRMYRNEYDGSECWAMVSAFKQPTVQLEITTVCSGRSWDTLANMNKIEE
jgi:hypothetical protein